MKQVIKIILRYPFRLIMSPYLIFIMGRMYYKHRYIIWEDETRPKALNLLFEWSLLQAEKIDFAIDIVLLIITAGFYSLLFDKEENETTR